MKLLSIIPGNNIMNSFDNSWKNINSYVNEHGLDGIETMIGTFHSPSYLKDANVIGLHLMYFPTWLDLWNEDIDECIHSFGSPERVRETFGGFNKELLIDHYRKEFENAKKLGVEYMVFHIAHVKPRDIFTFKHSYTSRDVIDAAIELINEVFTGEGPALLMENLFWPGLDLRSNDDTRFLLDSINYTNKGLLLDLSHLICTGSGITTFDEGADFILKRLDELGALIGDIRGIHLNASTPGNYLNQSFDHILSSWEEADNLDKYRIEGNHIKNIDTHCVFESNKLKDILDKIPYEYLTLELSYTSREELSEKIKLQKKFLDRV